MRRDREGTDAERHARDDIFYFDLIYRRTDKESLDHTAHNLDVVVHAVCSTSSYFPAAPEIDSTNGIGYELIAPEFTDSLRLTTANFHTISQEFFQSAIRQLVGPGRSCLEIGPGGGWLRQACDWPDAPYTCADISRAMLVKSEALNGRCVSATARSLPFEGGSFDAVFASLGDSYCYPAALCELRRVLRGGGSLVFSSPAREWADGIRSPDASSTTFFRLRDGRETAVYSFALSLSELARLVELCGFEIASATAMTGAGLDVNQVAPMVLKAAKIVGISVSDLPIVNCVHARKAGAS